MRPIHRLPHPNGIQTPAWWREVERFLDEEIAAAFELGQHAGLTEAKITVLRAIDDATTKETK